MNSDMMHMLTIDRTYYERFLKSVALHSFSRGQVKKGLKGLLISLLVDEMVTRSDVQRFIDNNPYDKEKYWKYCFDRLRSTRGYLNHQLHTINAAIIGSIQYENIV